MRQREACLVVVALFLVVHGACGKGDNSARPEKHRTAKQRLLEIRALIAGEEWDRAGVAISASAKGATGLDAAELAVCRGIVHKAQARPEEAKKSFEGVVFSARGSGPKQRVRAQLLKAEAAERLGKTTDAMHAYHAVLRHEPGHLRALKALEDMFFDAAPSRIHLREIGRPFQFGTWFGWSVTAFELAVGSPGKLTVELVDRGTRLEGFTREVSADAPIKLVFGYRERTGKHVLEAVKYWVGASAKVTPLKAMLPADRTVMEFGVQLHWLVGQGTVRWESFLGQSPAFKHSTGGSTTSTLSRGHFTRHDVGKFFEVHQRAWGLRGDSFQSRKGADGTEVRVRGSKGTGWVWKPARDYASPIWVLRAKFEPNK